MNKQKLPSITSPQVHPHGHFPGLLILLVLTVKESAQEDPGIWPSPSVAWRSLLEEAAADNRAGFLKNPVFSFTPVPGGQMAKH